ncbi:uncharacterized protein SCHCODRAFT_02672851 [Schizophyllum commune H4-8]|uniref:uncharacterized protein n=1 Tax=Schizophyllum commune (strain H4-8 / FGSC 9210) TaxID=578458 RepID=UPI002160B424|nr:uncharacterized protein SCHCODRAFT_02672851 [Schizophyllum commune H4-8]KAI5886714.1 hypothetical protein SCHCODRAFT_02672851 [Schizophyllum commune H4-8]
MSPDTCDVALCSCFNTRDLVRYSQVCRDTRRAVQSYSSQAFQLHRTLVNFMSVDEVRAFRQLMRETGTLISGSVAIHFFSRTDVGESGLDLYMEGDNAHNVAAFVQKLGYAYQPRMYQNQRIHNAIAHATSRYAIRDSAIYEMPAILDKFTFDREGTKIHLLVADLSAIDAILDFHSTVVMNIITHRAAYALYPQSTFKANMGICFDEDPINGDSSKYRERGWDLRCAVEDRACRSLHGEITNNERYVGDRYTWTINFDDRLVPSTSLAIMLMNR